MKIIINGEEFDITDDEAMATINALEDKYFAPGGELEHLKHLRGIDMSLEIDEEE